ncbi:DnaJ domain-containing protein [endosymbiont GvMRE of Glomus versiforme]|uniref:DnaJ domain-containing protein n=1 Tax=endosymbiont GvMRE of Glomus versiforme TaxID=2039283 RepID=UPI000EE766FF|nr:DnaJ domain-containing protein [endosymbiont GvMRE of Glomus versiforme]RHZ35735.1 DnaJ-like protein [endosymbiont GvMRE of Glomus versiforme]
MKIEEKNKAFKILGLDKNKSVSEIEIKRAYRKLFFQYHSEKDNLAASRKKFQEFQEAYELLIADFSINCKVNFGVSEEEIEKFKEEILEENPLSKNLNDLMDLKEVKNWALKERSSFFGEFEKRYKEELGFEVFQEKYNYLASLRNSVSSIFSNVEKVKKIISRDGSNTEEILFYSSSEQSEIFRNWLNYLYLFYGLKKDSSFIDDWIKNKIGNPIRSTKYKKETFEEVKEKLESPLSDNEQEEYLKRLREIKTGNPQELYDSKEELLLNKRIELLRKKIRESFNFPLLTELINLEISNKDDLPYEELSDEKKVDYWVNWLKKKGEWTEKKMRERFVNFLLKIYNNKKRLIKEANRNNKKEFYDTLELPEGATSEQIEKQYKKLALKYHPDKSGGDTELFKKLENARKVLRNEAESMKYDLCLEELDEEDKIIDSDYLRFYSNLKQWRRMSKSRVNKEFAGKIKFVLEEELKSSDLTWEEIIDYGKIWKYEDYSRLWKENELMKIEDFCLSISEIYQHEAIKRVRDYLKIIGEANGWRRVFWEKIEELGLDGGARKSAEEKLLSAKPKLTKEELSEPGKVNCIRKIDKLLIEIVLEEDKEKIKELKEKSWNLFGEVLDRIEEVQKVKSKLLEKINKWIEEGNDLLNSKDKEKINKYLTDFSGFLSSLKEKESYEIEVELMIKTVNKTKNVAVNQKVIEKVLGEKENEMGSLFSKLKLVNAENSEVEEELLGEKSTESSKFSSNVNKEDKQKIIEYLDNLIINAVFVKDKELTRAREVVFCEDPINYSRKINGANSKLEVEDIRATVIDKIFYYLSSVKRGRGNNDRESQELLTSFVDLVKQEISKELGKDFTDLPSETQELLEVSSAEKLTESKKAILRKEISCREKKEIQETIAVNKLPIPKIPSFENEKSEQINNSTPFLGRTVSTLPNNENNRWLMGDDIKKAYDSFKENRELRNVFLLDPLYLGDLASGNSREEKERKIDTLINKRLNENELVFLPANKENNHWSLFVYEKSKKTLHYYDSYGNSSFPYFKPLCKEIFAKLGISAGEIENHLKVEKMPQQNNGYDCGVYVIAATRALLERYRQDKEFNDWSLDDKEDFKFSIEEERELLKTQNTFSNFSDETNKNKNKANKGNRETEQQQNKDNNLQENNLVKKVVFDFRVKKRFQLSSQEGIIVYEIYPSGDLQKLLLRELKIKYLQFEVNRELFWFDGSPVENLKNEHLYRLKIEKDSCFTNEKDLLTIKLFNDEDYELKELLGESNHRQTIESKGDVSNNSLILPDIRNNNYFDFSSSETSTKDGSLVDEQRDKAKKKNFLPNSNLINDEEKPETSATNVPVIIGDSAMSSVANKEKKYKLSEIIKYANKEKVDLNKKIKIVKLATIKKLLKNVKTRQLDKLSIDNPWGDENDPNSLIYKIKNAKKLIDNNHFASQDIFEKFKSWVDISKKISKKKKILGGFSEVKIGSLKWNDNLYTDKIWKEIATIFKESKEILDENKFRDKLSFEFLKEIIGEQKIGIVYEAGAKLRLREFIKDKIDESNDVWVEVDWIGETNLEKAQVAAINEVNNTWNTNEIGGRVNGRDKDTVLERANWADAINNGTVETAINAERDRLIRLITVAKEQGTQQQQQQQPFTGSTFNNNQQSYQSSDNRESYQPNSQNVNNNSSSTNSVNGSSSSSETSIGGSPGGSPFSSSGSTDFDDSNERKNNFSSNFPASSTDSFSKDGTNLPTSTEKPDSTGDSFPAVKNDNNDAESLKEEIKALKNRIDNLDNKVDTVIGKEEKIEEKIDIILSLLKTLGEGKVFKSVEEVKKFASEEIIDKGLRGVASAEECQSLRSEMNELTSSQAIVKHMKNFIQEKRNKIIESKQLSVNTQSLSKNEKKPIEKPNAIWIIAGITLGMGIIGVFIYWLIRNKIK